MALVLRIVLVLLPFCQSAQDSVRRYKENLTLAPLYKYYVYTEAIGLINGFNINVETFIKQHKSQADYFRVWLGFQKDKDWIQNYPKLQGEYTAIGALFYVFIKNKARFSYELAPCFGGNVGDPNARLHLKQGYEGSKWTAFSALSLGIRYTFKKNPINLRVSFIPVYNITINKFYPYLLSLSFGYAFKKIPNNAAKYKISTSYSSTK